MMAGVIISREQWGAQPTRGGTPRALTDVDTCFLHYSDTHESIPSPPVAGDAATVRAIQAYHFSRGYVDIAYEAIIGGAGDIFVGRANDITDASTCNNNRNGYGVCVLTDYWLTAAQAHAVRFCVELGRLRFPNMAAKPKPHRAACSTACPGDVITAWIDLVAW